MRISSSSLQEIISQSLQSQQTKLAEKQITISSGKSYQVRSDAPTDASRSAKEKQAQSLDTQWGNNVEFALNWTIVSEEPIDTLVSNIQRANELAIQSLDGTKTTEDLRTIAEEVDSIIEQVLLISNRTYGGNYLFGGTSGQQPFTEVRDAAGKIISVGTAGVDSSQQRNIRASETFNADYGATATGSEGVFQNTTYNVDIFATLIDMRNTLEAGIPPVDSPTTGVQGLQNALDNAVNSLVKVGENQKYLTALQDHYENLELEHIQQIESFDEVDLAKEATELAKLEVSLQAAMQMAVKLNDMSLIKFL